jgi:hypothetical protein
MELTVQNEGTVTFESASTDGDKFNNKVKRKVLVKNDGASPVDVTVVAQEPCQLGELHDEVITVPAGDTAILPELQDKFYTDDLGFTHLDYSDKTSLTVAVIDA